MKIELDENLSCKDAEGVVWTLVPTLMSDEVDKLAKRYKRDKTMSSDAFYRYLLKQKRSFKQTIDGVAKEVIAKPKVKRLPQLLILFIMAYFSIKYGGDIYNHLVTNSCYSISIPSWVIINVFLAMTCLWIILTNKRGK